MQFDDEKERIASEKRYRRGMEIGVLLTVISPFVADLLGYPALGPYVFAVCLVGTVALALGRQIDRIAARVDRT